MVCRSVAIVRPEIDSDTKFVFSAKSWLIKVVVLLLESLQKSMEKKFEKHIKIKKTNEEAKKRLPKQKNHMIRSGKPR